MYDQSGRPPGIPRQGLYGKGVKTKTCRIPVDCEIDVPRLLIELPEIIGRYESAKKSTRNWVEAKRLLDELRSLIDVSE